MSVQMVLIYVQMLARMFPEVVQGLVVQMLVQMVLQGVQMQHMQYLHRKS